MYMERPSSESRQREILRTVNLYAHCIQNTANKIAISMCGARWVPEISGEHFVKYVIV